MRGIFVLFVAAAFSATAMAQAPAKGERSITVVGSGSVFVKPDTARIFYGVRATEPSTDATKDQVTKVVTAMDEAVKKLKLTNATTTVAPVTIRQVLQNQNNLGIPVPPGGAPAAGGLGNFVGNAAFTATITDANPDKLRAAVEAFVKAVSEAGANSPGDDRDPNPNIFNQGGETASGPKVILSKSDDSAAQEQALKKAVAQALRSAKVISQALGGGDPVVVSVTEAADVEKPAAESAAAMIYGIETPQTPRVPAGEIEVKVKIVVKLSY